MTEAEALDMAAKAAGWGSWGGALRSANRGVIEALRAHAKTIVAMAELMTACEQATTRMELMYLQHRKVVDKNAALKAECERLREALETIVNNCGQCGGYGTYPEEEIITGKVLWSDCSSPQCKEARTALERIDHGDR